jgi:hypothetical protein
MSAQTNRPERSEIATENKYNLGPKTSLFFFVSFFFFLGSIVSAFFKQSLLALLFTGAAMAVLVLILIIAWLYHESPYSLELRFIGFSALIAISASSSILLAIFYPNLNIFVILVNPIVAMIIFGLIEVCLYENNRRTQAVIVLSSHVQNLGSMTLQDLNQPWQENKNIPVATHPGGSSLKMINQALVSDGADSSSLPGATY